MNQEELNTILQFLKESYSEEEKEEFILFLLTEDKSCDFDLTMFKVRAFNDIYKLLR